MTLWVGLSLTKDADFTALQNDVFAVSGGGDKKRKVKKQFASEKLKFRPMPIYTSSEMANYYQL